MEKDICVICGDSKENSNLVVCYGCDEQGFDNFTEGVTYALKYLADLYDGIKETDLWAEYIVEQEAN